MNKIYSIKELVTKGNIVKFVKYFDGALWYKVIGFVQCGPDTVEHNMLEFPVPISDIGNATFLAEDKAILFMRYIRKHLELLKEAKDAVKEPYPYCPGCCEPDCKGECAFKGR